MALEVCNNSNGSTSIAAENSELTGENDSESDERYEMSIQVLRQETRNVISALLNPYKVIPTEKGIPRDWQGLAELIGVTGEHLPQFELERDPTAKLLNFWYGKDKEKCTVKRLLIFFEELDRFDVLDDVKALVDADISVFQKGSELSQPSHSDLEADKLILTIDDVMRLHQGLEPQRYDAFVLFADDDIDFATQLLETMEKQYNLKLCVKDRDLVGGAFEHQVIIKLISERCNRLVVIVSPAFIESPANAFFVSFTQAIAIEQRQRKIIPCLYRPCKVPSELRCYFMLDYNKSGKLWNFWERLRDSIRTPKSTPTSHPPVYGRCFSEVTRTNVFMEEHLRRSLHSRRLRPPRTVVKFNSMVSLNVEEGGNAQNDPTLNQSPSSSSLSAMNPMREEVGKAAKTKTSWLKKLLSNKNDKKTEKKTDKKEDDSKVKNNSKTDNNGVIEKVHHKNKKHFWAMPMKRKVAILN